MAPTLTPRARRRLAAAERMNERVHWSRDEDAFAFVVADHEARTYVQWEHYWSSWVGAEDETNARSRDHVKDSRTWEDAQVARAEAPVGYWLRDAEGHATWVEPTNPRTRDNTDTAAERAAEVHLKGSRTATPAERKRLSRWRKRAAGTWTCTVHDDPTLTACGIDCHAQYVADRERAVHATVNATNVNVHAQ